MGSGYLTGILIKLLLVQAVVACLLLVTGLVVEVSSNPIAEEDDNVIKTIVFKDDNGQERVEYAFLAPAQGLPNHVLELYCSSVKLRLYWNGYREEVKQSHRKGLYLRRMARFAKHVFEEVRDVDKPFNATMLSRVDKHFMAKFDEADNDFDDDDLSDTDISKEGKKTKLKLNIKSKISKMIKPTKHEENSEILEEIDSSETVKDLAKQGQNPAVEKIRKFAKNWNFKKTALLIYTRWRTMWWMTLSCLYAKYYLWDPALDEFTKLKRSLLMWPELQLVKLQDLQCKPVIFFRRIMDICKMLNPLMRVDFGQFNYNSLSRFKSDS